MPDLSPRLRKIVDALPLRPGLRVVEIGCGPGAAAREIARRVGPTGFVLAVDRSPRATAEVLRTGADLVSAGRLHVRTVACEDLELESGEQPFDLGLAVRVGALDGRHPDAGRRARARLAAVMAPGGRFFVDGGDPLRELDLDTT